jgi:hypothetical protein
MSFSPFQSLFQASKDIPFIAFKGQVVVKPFVGLNMVFQN